MAPDFKMQKSSQLLRTIVAASVFHLSKMGKFGIKYVPVYIITKLQDKFLE